MPEEQNFSNDKIKDHITVFQQIMLVILQRRALFRAFENSIIGKESSIASNYFVNFYVTDCTRAQLTDLRKFFDTNPKSYRFPLLINCLHNDDIEKQYEDLKKMWICDQAWGTSFKNLSNGVVMHQDISRKAESIYKNHLDDFIDRLNGFLDIVVEELTNQGYEFGCLDRSLDNDFLKNQQQEDFDKFLSIASQD